MTVATMQMTYPAIPATTADTDERVVPGHSFEYVATLQAADIGDRPHLPHVETPAGHGLGKPVDKMIDEVADRCAFAAYWTELKIGRHHDAEIGQAYGCAHHRPGELETLEARVARLKLSETVVGAG